MKEIFYLLPVLISTGSANQHNVNQWFGKINMEKKYGYTDLDAMRAIPGDRYQSYTMEPELETIPVEVGPEVESESRRIMLNPDNHREMHSNCNFSNYKNTASW